MDGRKDREMGGREEERQEGRKGGKREGIRTLNLGKRTVHYVEWFPALLHISDSITPNFIFSCFVSLTFVFDQTQKFLNASSYN